MGANRIGVGRCPARARQLTRQAHEGPCLTPTQRHRRLKLAVFYFGKLVFAKEKLYYRVLHNDTAYALQRQLQFGGMQTVVLPIRITLG